ncbi:MAG: hypothetical protein ACKN9D_00295 [Actinomycetales bacterium]
MPKAAGRLSRQVLLAIAVASVLIAIALAGADHPPPPGFLILMGLVAAWTAAVSAVRWRTRTLTRPIQALATCGSGGLLGLLAWLALAVRAVLIEGTALTWLSAIGIAVSLVLAGCGGLVLAFLSWVIVDRGTPSAHDHKAP